ncbi:RIP metalloprotease RseP [Lactobacillus jensenii]|uniref:RIP metalloprotease RseP n=1 Tax=Lactobacillus jensenii TaxID=109790 RepID=UPI0013D5E3E8|nr:RIP metalloprotease RseP [Lactobacillus jensenii]MCZ4008097.1 RIP metalloprotease RseP [Lactobacillus jensenii]MCZ4011541.1 RIP metalloprotease RseP [Lactobacillus jensenii]NGG31773.1 RIP metalloprotease RseP [Lactobacillus jensenii]
MTTVLIFLVIFGLLVFVHEFGHFFVAKKSGVLVREFSIGMGPKLFQTRRKKTSYTIRWLPLGGYVRLAGKDDISTIDPGTNVILVLDEKGKVVRIDASESDILISGIPVQVTKADLVKELTIQGYENGDESKECTYSVDHDATIIDNTGTELSIAPEDTQFQNAKIWQKISTNIAGPLMNIILGFVIFIIWSISTVGPSTTTIARTLEHSPASTVLKKNDQIIAVNGKKVAENKSKKMQVTVKRASGIKTFSLTPKLVKRNSEKVYQIGIFAKSDERFSVKLARGWNMAVNTTGLIFKAVGNLISHFSLNKLSGPVGIYSQTSQVSKFGLSAVVVFLAMISINLGIMNLLPIPGLDGGKLLLNLVELIRGKPIPEEHETAVEIAGVVFLLILIILVTGNDIYRYFIK